MARRTAELGLLIATLVLFGACSDAGEGESCDLANGNDDCEQGLICRGPWEVKSKSAVCCPAPPARSSVNACDPKVESYEPDPTVDAAAIPPGTGGGAGSGGSGGSAGDDGGDAADGDTDGAAGSDGAAGTDGAAGADSGDASSDATSD